MGFQDSDRVAIFGEENFSACPFYDSSNYNVGLPKAGLGSLLGSTRISFKDFAGGI
jgi:hypothetical protein